MEVKVILHLGSSTVGWVRLVFSTVFPPFWDYMSESVFLSLCYSLLFFCECFPLLTLYFHNLWLHGGEISWCGIISSGKEENRKFKIAHTISGRVEDWSILGFFLGGGNDDAISCNVVQSKFRHIQMLLWLSNVTLLATVYLFKYVLLMVWPLYLIVNLLYSVPFISERHVIFIYLLYCSYYIGCCFAILILHGVEWPTYTICRLSIFMLIAL